MENRRYFLSLVWSDKNGKFGYGNRTIKTDGEITFEIIEENESDFAYKMGHNNALVLFYSEIGGDAK